MVQKDIYIYVIAIFLIIFIFYQLNCEHFEPFGFVENEIVPLKELEEDDPFDVVMVDRRYGNALIINLKHLFTFMEKFQVDDMDPRNEWGNKLCHKRDEIIIIQNAIKQILKNLRFIVYSNNKDNFYNRFIVSKVGPNLKKYMNKHNNRKMNYDEMVKNKIGKQFTFLQQNEYDKYYPRPNIDSSHQNPLPTSINIHNYYTYENIELNLLAFRMLIEMCQGNDHSKFGFLVRPTEHVAFEEEFMVPLKSAINAILTIIHTSAYAQYLHNYKTEFF